MQMRKAGRQALIRDILGRRSISTQRELRSELATHGCEVDQATLSRDVRDIGVVKTHAGYALPNGTVQVAKPDTVPTLEQAFAIVPAGSLIVIKTAPGQANPTAIVLDSASHPGILGTIAGDDTVFVATPNPKSARALAAALQAKSEGDRP